jgi:hypothetical protein
MMPPSAPAQEKNQAALVKKQAAPAQGLRRTAAVAVADKKPHRLILQVNSNDPAMMNLALNNATNVAQYTRTSARTWRLTSSLSARACICCGRHLTGQGEDQGYLGKHAVDCLRSLRQYARKYEQGREQGSSADFRSEGGEIRSRACHGTAGAGVDLCEAVMALPPAKPTAFA